MAYEAFDAGVEPGGLRDTNEVKILVCWLLKSVGSPLSFDNLNEIIVGDGLVNYFELAQAVRDLLVSGHIDLTGPQSTDLYRCTELGAGTASLFERRLPRSVRDKATCAAVKLLTRIEREAENVAEITQNPSGDYQVCCKILDRGEPLLQIALLVPGQDQAQMVKKHFTEDPETVYRGVVALLTGDRAVSDKSPSSANTPAAGPDAVQ